MSSAGAVYRLTGHFVRADRPEVARRGDTKKKDSGRAGKEGRRRRGAFRRFAENLDGRAAVRARISRRGEGRRYHVN